MSTTDVAAVLLAGGGSRRLGRPKQLVSYGGEPLVRRAARTACASSCGRVVVVVGAAREAVRLALEDLPVDIVTNEEWSEGMASSIRRGVENVASENEAAALLVTCDQPALTAAHLDRIVARWYAGAQAVGSQYAGSIGVPALFDRSLFAALRDLRGDAGAKKVLRSVVAEAIDWPEGAFDVDTAEDLAELSDRLGNRPFDVTRV